jgi:hypothetical protein
MNRRNMFALYALALCAGTMTTSGAIAQQKSLKEQLVGAWTLVSAVDVHPDGRRVDVWGANPKGVYMFDANGRFAQMLMRSDLPKFANRAQGTSEQNKAVVQGSIAFYGTYTINEADKAVVVHYEGSTFATFNGADGKRTITSLTTDELKLTNPATSTGLVAESVWKRAK